MYGQSNSPEPMGISQFRANEGPTAWFKDLGGVAEPLGLGRANEARRSFTYNGSLQAARDPAALAYQFR